MVGLGSRAVTWLDSGRWRNRSWMSGATSTEISTAPADTSPYALIHADTGSPRIRTHRHILIRADAAPGGLITRSSEDQLQDRDRSARILPCSAWERSWEEAPGRSSKHTVTWVFAVRSGPLTSTTTSEHKTSPRLDIEARRGGPRSRDSPEEAFPGRSAQKAC